MTPAVVGARPDLRWVRVRDLSVDPDYQRSIQSKRSQRVIRAIAENFSWAMFGAIQVGERPDGSLKILDGQHRVAGCDLRGDIPEVPAVVVPMPDRAAEARAFVAINGDRTNPTPLQVHRAMVAAGDKDALVIDRACRAAGVVLLKHPVQKANLRPGETMAVCAVKTVIREHGEKVARRALEILVRAYRTRGGGIRATFIRTVAAVIDGRFGPPPSKKDLTDFLYAEQQGVLLLQVETLRQAEKLSALDALAKVILGKMGHAAAPKAPASPRTEKPAWEKATAAPLTVRPEPKRAPRRGLTGAEMAQVAKFKPRRFEVGTFQDLLQRSLIDAGHKAEPSFKKGKPCWLIDGRQNTERQAIQIANKHRLKKKQEPLSAPAAA